MKNFPQGVGSDVGSSFRAKAGREVRYWTHAKPRSHEEAVPAMRAKRSFLAEHRMSAVPGTCLVHSWHQEVQQPEPGRLRTSHVAGTSKTR